MALTKQTPHCFSARRCVRAVVQNVGRIAGPLVWVALAVAAQAQSDRVVITSQPGYAITWDGNNGGFRGSFGDGAGPTNNAALASNGTVPFGSSEYGTPHFIINVNDGFYGNSSSWISDFTKPDPNPFIGLNFNKTVALESIAWSRDNTTDDVGGASYLDRCVGTYTLQVTTVANPGASTAEASSPAAGWVTIGTVQYLSGNDSITFTAAMRHRFDISAGGAPISATGIRIKVSDANIDIDEIEVNPGPDPNPPITNFIVVQSAAGYSLGWDGNNGKFNNPASPAPVPKNRALASQGSTAFGSSEYGHGVHFATNVIDGFYGNSHSWISDFTQPDPNPYIGVSFGGSVELKTVAWGRDNGDDTEGPSNPNTDRVLGTYTLQVTQVQNPGTGTSETGDPATGWITIGTLNYKAASTNFVPYLRHRYDVATTNGSTITATGLRIKVPTAGTCIDELEVNTSPVLEQDLVLLTPEAGFSLTWDENNGDFFNSITNGGLASVPDNDALATKGVTPFGSTELAAYGHVIVKVNNGYYGNAQSWIPGPDLPSTDADPFIGLRFGKTIAIKSVAWGRDNRGQYVDRSASRTYTLQFTKVTNPGLDTSETGDAASGWATVGTVQYGEASLPDFQPAYRHRFEVAQGGNPISATGLRIKVSLNDTCIDEIEVNPAATTVSIIGDPSDVVAVESGPVTFQVSAVVAGVASPIFYQWQRNDVDIPGATNATYTTPTLTAADTGAKFRVLVHANNTLVVTSREALFTLRANNTDALQESFTGGALDATKWSTIGGVVSIVSNHAEFTPGTRVFLLSTGQYSPSVPGGLMVTGRITTVAPGDFTVWTRAASVVDPRTDLPTRKENLDTGLRFNFRTDGTTPALTATARALSAADGAAFGTVVGNITIGAAVQTWDFVLADSGSAVSFTVTEVGNAANSATLIGASTIHPSSFHVAFDSGSSDAFTGQPTLVTLDDIVITSAPAALTITPATGYSLSWNGNSGAFSAIDAPASVPNNAASATNGATAFGSSERGGNYLIAHANDGIYGDANSWMAQAVSADANPYVGIRFSSLVAVTNVAWGRDNTQNPDLGGTNRGLGVYTLQITRVTNPGTTTPETGDPVTGWANVGTLQYQAGPLFVANFRHRYDVASAPNGSAIEATGLRLKVSNNEIAIDEIEVNVSPLAEKQFGVLQIVPESGYTIAWDGNDGQFSGTNAPANDALASKGTVAIGSSEYGQPHFVKNVNDGVYGNSQSWIANPTDSDPFIGVNFGRSLSVTNIAWSRDNTPAPPYLDRCLGTYIIQVTTVASPSVSTAETGDPATGWATVGTWTYLQSSANFFRAYARHRFELARNGAPIVARGLRVKAPNGTDLDELEVNTAVPVTAAVTLAIQRQGAAVTISWTGGGTVQAADDVAGPWADVTDSSNPYTPTTSAAKKFYRVRQ